METHGTPVAQTGRMRERLASTHPSLQSAPASTETTTPAPSQPAGTDSRDSRDNRDNRDSLDKYDISTIHCTE